MSFDTYESRIFDAFSVSSKVRHGGRRRFVNIAFHFFCIFKVKQMWGTNSNQFGARMNVACCASFVHAW